MELVYETRWSRHYKDDDLQLRVCESKFADGSASITADELAKEWSHWDRKDQVDFCQSVIQAKFVHLPDILRFIMKNGDWETWSAIATSVVRNLPKEEALPFIEEACRVCPVGKGELLFQALAFHRSREVVPTLRECLSRTWSDSRLMSDDAVYDWAAHDATALIEYLSQLGERAPDLREKYQVLVNHPLATNRQNAVHRLTPYFK